MDVKFREVPGQEGQTVTGSRWPSSNDGWRLGVAIGAAIILLSLLACFVGVAIGG